MNDDRDRGTGAIGYEEVAMIPLTPEIVETSSKSDPPSDNSTTMEEKKE